MIKIDISNSTIHLSGEFLRSELEEETYNLLPIERNQNYMAVCNEIQNINSFFVTWLIGLQRKLNTQGSRLTIQSPPKTFSQLISLYRLEETLTITE